MFIHPSLFSTMHRSRREHHQIDNDPKQLRNHRGARELLETKISHIHPNEFLTKDSYDKYVENNNKLLELCTYIEKYISKISMGSVVLISRQGSPSTYPAKRSIEIYFKINACNIWEPGESKIKDNVYLNFSFKNDYICYGETENIIFCANSFIKTYRGQGLKGLDKDLSLFTADDIKIDVNREMGKFSRFVKNRKKLMDYKTIKIYKNKIGLNFKTP